MASRRRCLRPADREVVPTGRGPVRGIGLALGPPLKSGGPVAFRPRVLIQASARIPASSTSRHRSSRRAPGRCGCPVRWTTPGMRPPSRGPARDRSRSVCGRCLCRGRPRVHRGRSSARSWSRSASSCGGSSSRIRPAARRRRRRTASRCGRNRRIGRRTRGCAQGRCRRLRRSAGRRPAAARLRETSLR